MPSQALEISFLFCFFTQAPLFKKWWVTCGYLNGYLLAIYRRVFWHYPSRQIPARYPPGTRGCFCSGGQVLFLSSMENNNIPTIHTMY